MDDYSTIDELIEKTASNNNENELIEVFEKVLSTDWHNYPNLNAEFVSKTDTYLISETSVNKLSPNAKNTVSKCHESFLKQIQPWIAKMPFEIRQAVIALVKDPSSLFSMSNSTKMISSDLAEVLKKDANMRRELLKEAFVQNRLLELGARLATYKIAFQSTDFASIPVHMTKKQLWALLRFTELYVQDEALAVRVVIPEDGESHQIAKPATNKNTIISSIIDSLNSYFANAATLNTMETVSQKKPRHLFSITSLKLSNSQLPLELLRELIQACPMLEELDLSYYQEGSLQHWIGQEDFGELISFPNLKKLNLCAAPIYLAMFSCPELEVLNLVAGIGSATKITQHKHLKSLNIAKCNITDENLQVMLAGCPKIQELFLGSYYEEIKYTAVLGSDYIGDYLLTDTGLQSILSLKQLKKLQLSFQDISEELFIKILQKYPELELLNVYGTNLSLQALRQIGSLHMLKELRISRDAIIWNNEGIDSCQTILQNNSNLEVLDCNGPLHKLKAIPTLSKVETLSILSTELTNACWDKIRTSAPNLKNLTLANLNDASSYVIETTPALEGLWLQGDRGTHYPDCMKNIAKLSQLRSLVLWGIPITDDEFCNIAENCTHLEEVVMIQCDVQNESVEKLFKLCPNLRTFAMYMVDQNWVEQRKDFFINMRKLYPNIIM